jgi:hypothetical protein
MQQKFDYTKLRERIREKYETPEIFAQVIDLPPVTLTAKLNCAVDFTQSEINKLCVSLGIKDREITEFFFNNIKENFTI